MNIQADNPVLVVGAGPSYPKYYEEIKKFPGKIIVLDVNFNNCVRKGVRPDYVITLESGTASVKREMFAKDCLEICKGGTTAVVSPITRENIINYVKGYLSYIRHPFENENNISNAGLFALIFAYRVLKADKIAVVGFEHEGTEYSEYLYRMWQTDFWYYVKKWPKQTVINCSDGGALYFKDYVIDTTLDKLKIKLILNESID